MFPAPFTTGVQATPVASIRGRYPYEPGMNYQGDLTALNQCTVKKRTWKKPKDKPKRPLSAYNIFFQFERTRIVNGDPEDMAGDEIVRSIELIIAKSTIKRRHRKTHGKISFRDLARQIADRWKRLDKATRSYFDTYAEVDMKRYKEQVEEWKKLKEDELSSALTAASILPRSNAQMQERELDSLQAQYEMKPTNEYIQPEEEEWNDLKQRGTMVRRNALPPVFSQTSDLSAACNHLGSRVGSAARRMTGGSIEPIPLSEMDESNGEDVVMTPSCGKIVHRLFADDRMEQRMEHAGEQRNQSHFPAPPLTLSDYCSVPNMDHPFTYTPPHVSNTVSGAIAIATPDTPESSHNLARFLEHLDFSAL